jgi:lantibiotic biosynthesis dehydratase-like protein
VEKDEATWIAYHLFYYEDPRRAVLGFVRPAVSALLDSDLVESFFFLRYALGGPHVRLRLRPAEGRVFETSETVEALAREFLATSPSISSLDAETIRRGNEAFVAGDPHETDLAVYPDNSFLPFPFRPEVERYGGPERLAASLDFFAISSAAALDFLARTEGQPRSRQLAGALAALARQALAFALDEEELAALFRYGVDSWGAAMPAIIDKADRLVAEQGEGFRRLFAKELLDLRSAPPDGSTREGGPWLREASRRLSLAIGREDSAARRRVGTSQLHMTANRLGLSNPEEVYLSRILSLLLAERLASPERADELRAALEDSVSAAGTPATVREILPGALAILRGNP